MLFSPQPKTNREELFDREKELKDLSKALDRYPMVVVTGLRRVGKSSVVRVFLSENSLPFIYVDGRRVYEMSGGSMGSHALQRALEMEFSRLSKSRKLLNFLKKIKGINIAGSGVEIDKREFDLTSTFESFDRFAKNEGRYFVVFFDEVQYFKFYGSRGGKDILALLSFVYDNLENVKIVMTGSEVGMLHDFLRLDDYDSPLYGRPLFTMTVHPFSEELSIEFLKRGFKEVGVNVDFDLEEVVSQIDGIPGYLVLFGLKYLETRNVKRALEEVFSTMEVLFSKELEELDRRSRRYRTILKLVASGVKSWSGIKRYFASTGEPISDSRLHSLLLNLEKMSFVEKTRDGYRISDPVLVRVISRQKG